jgi:hypothetical protein
LNFLYGCVSYLSVALLHLEIWEFVNLGIFIICIRVSITLVYHVGCWLMKLDVGLSHYVGL